MQTQVINATEYRNVPLSLLNESKTNPRRAFDASALKELADFVSLTVLWPRAPKRRMTAGGPHSEGHITE
jgi:hypothetical protein